MYHAAAVLAEGTTEGSPRKAVDEEKEPRGSTHGGFAYKFRKLGAASTPGLCQRSQLEDHAGLVKLLRDREPSAPPQRSQPRIESLGSLDL